MSKITIIEGNSNDKDQIRTFMVKGEKGDKGDKGDKGQDGANSKTSELINDSGFITMQDVENEGYAKDTDIQAQFNNFKGQLFPVRSVFITTTNTNPSTFLGGTWEQVAQGQFIVGVGTGTDINDTVRTFVAGENQGEYEHTQTVNEMAQHNHEINDPGHAHDYGLGEGGSYTAKIGALTPTTTQNRGGTDRNTTGITIRNAGAGQAMNITPPSFGMYIWQRTA